MTIAERTGSGKEAEEASESLEGYEIQASRLSRPGAGPGSEGQGKGIPERVLVAIVVLLTALASFGLGILAGRADPPTPDDSFWIEKLEAAGLDAVPVATGKGSEVSVSAERGPAAAAAAPKAAPTTQGAYVASKTGTKYYTKECGAKRIKEENKVWFATKAEAEAAGYKPAKNCKNM